MMICTETFSLWRQVIISRDSFTYNAGMYSFAVTRAKSVDQPTNAVSFEVEKLPA